MTLFNRLRLREFGKFEFADPAGFLVKLREFENGVEWGETPANIRHLRTNGLKPFREMRDAALFCVGISEVLQKQVRFAPVESADYDFVVTWQVGETQNFCPVQLKEVASHLNPLASVDDLLAGLTKYPDSDDLVFAIKLNSSFDPEAVVVPKGPAFGGLWFFGSITPDQSEWAIWGDFNMGPEARSSATYRYPAG